LHDAVVSESVFPVTTPGFPVPKPVIAVPGQVPMSPVTTVAPVLVMVVAATTPKVLARPKTIGGLRS
jgi:hypothetical protein